MQSQVKLMRVGDEKRKICLININRSCMVFIVTESLLPATMFRESLLPLLPSSHNVHGVPACYLPATMFRESLLPSSHNVQGVLITFITFQPQCSRSPCMLPPSHNVQGVLITFQPQCSGSVLPSSLDNDIQSLRAADPEP
jgi:hypothetical protein